jgi:exodeoxyribonuclease VII large subunit
VLSHRLDRAASELHHTLARLRTLSPLSTLERGYAVVRRATDGVVLRSPDDTSVGEELRIRLAAGELTATVAPSAEHRGEAKAPVRSVGTAGSAAAADTAGSAGSAGSAGAAGSAGSAKRARSATRAPEKGR